MDGWLATGSHTRCPKCKSLKIYVKDVLQVKPLGTFSLSGTQLKTTGRYTTVYKCFDCEATGPATPKTEEEKGKWVDGN